MFAAFLAHLKHGRLSQGLLSRKLARGKDTSKGQLIDRLQCFRRRRSVSTKEGWITVAQKTRWWEVSVETGLATFIAEWRRTEDAETTARHAKAAGEAR